MKGFSNHVIGIFAVIAFFLSSCKKESSNSAQQCTTDVRYYSDYFVFLADDGGEPLVIPMDVNWSPIESGYEVELKAWHGTDEEWPIAYRKGEKIADSCAIPKEVWDHDQESDFSFDPVLRMVNSNTGGVNLNLMIPDSAQWVALEVGEGKTIYAFRSKAFVNGADRYGWMIYERIRRSPSPGGGGGANFEAFFWIPLVYNGDLYHFIQHRGVQAAQKWTNDNGDIHAQTVGSFEWKVSATVPDSVSGRDSIPNRFELNVPSENIALDLLSTGSQVGYGEMFPKGLAYYRQSLLEIQGADSTKGFGMLELILEED